MVKGEGTFEMVSGKKVELVGASRESLKVDGAEIHTTVTMDSKMRKKVIKSLTLAEDKTPTPDRIFLNLENVRGKIDSTAFHVYVGVPQGTSHDAHPNRLAGSIALFGVSDASDPDGKHAGQGLNYTLDITDIVDELYLGNLLDAEDLDVRLVPVKPIDKKAQVSVGRISVYRQGQ
jgi:tyrosinase